MIFDPINIILAVIALLNFVLGILIFARGYWREVHVVYTFNILAIIAWILAMIFFRLTPEETALIWGIALYAAPTLIASSFLYFTYVFPSREEEHIALKTALIFIINAAVVALLAMPGVIIEGVVVQSGQENEIIFSGYYWIYVLYILAFFTFGFLRLFMKYLRRSGLERLQIIYLAIGYALAANLAFVTNLIMPWLGHFFLNWMGPVFTILMVAFTGYAILRYRLMDVRVAARQVFIVVGAAGFVYGLFYFFIWFYESVFDGVHTQEAYLASLIVAPLFVVGLFGLLGILRDVADRYFFTGLYDYQGTINELTDKLNYYIELDTIITLIIDTVKDTLRLDRVAILLSEVDEDTVHYRVAKVDGFDEANGISLVQNNFLTDHLERTQKPLLVEELALLALDAQGSDERDAYRELGRHMRRIEASVCIPLLARGELIGVIVLGDKMSGDAYTSKDLELLNTMAKQAGTAILNAELYKQIDDFNKTLKERVDQQTKHLNELLEMKSDFLSVVNHQLNTPISIMRGYFSMMDEGEYTKEEALPAIRGALDRISQTVAEFRDAYELEGEQMKMRPERVDIKEIILAQVKEKRNMQLAKERELVITFDEPHEEIPSVWCDPKKIKHVISNMLDNAVNYTREGSVTASCAVRGNVVEVSVTDTGAGLTEDDERALFSKFSRGTYATNYSADGSGLGLFIAKRIVEGNGGEIYYESYGKNKGTTFYFTVPLFSGQESAEEKEEEEVSREKVVIFDKPKKTRKS